MPPVDGGSGISFPTGTRWGGLLMGPRASTLRGAENLLRHGRLKQAGGDANSFGTSIENVPHLSGRLGILRQLEGAVSFMKASTRLMIAMAEEMEPERSNRSIASMDA